MDALLLPGNSPRHKEWVDALREHLEMSFETVIAQHYYHWQTGEEWANVDDEVGASVGNTQDLNSFVIIGKSIGTTIAVKATAEGWLFPEKLVLLGIPIKGGAQPDEFASWLKTITIPVVIAQNTNDPLGSFQEVKNTFKNAGDNIVFFELPGDTHDYLDFETIANLAH